MTLKYRIALTIFVLEVLLVSAILGQTLGSVTENIEREFDRSERITMEYLATIGKSAMITDEFGDFHAHLGAVLQNPSVDSVFVVNTEGIIVASSSESTVGSRLRDLAAPTVIHARHQSMSEGALEIGSIIVWFSSAGLNAAIDTARSKGIRTAVVGIVGIAIIGILIGVALSRRLERLALAADRYTAGDPGIEIETTGKDETARLARSFRALIDRVQHSLDAMNNELDISRRVQTELANTEERYRNLIEGAELGIQVTGFDGRRLLLNRALINMLGYNSAEELVNLPPRSLVAPYHRDRALTSQIAMAPPESLPNQFELDVVRKDSSIQQTEVFWQIIDWDGEPAFHMTFIDITERKRAEAALVEREQNLRLLLDAISDGLFGLDTHGNCTFCNPTGLHLLGFEKPSDVVGRNMHDLIHHSYPDGRPYPEADCTIHSDLIHDQEMTFTDETFWRRDGSSFPAAVRSLPVKQGDGEVLGAVVTFCDLTESKKNKELIRQRDRIIREQQRELTKASQISAMGEVSTVIAHELNQPLTAIKSSADAMIRLVGMGGDNRKMLEELLPLISEQADRAGTVIQSIRSLFEDESIEMSEHNLRLLLDEACTLLALEQGSTELPITVTMGPSTETVVADRVQIQQVIQNLLRNALDAMHDSPRKQIQISTRTLDNGTVEISVADTGTGLPPDKLDTVFDAFVTTKNKGMGMGLYTCKTIVEAHLGTIRAENNEQGGATFKFALPLAHPAADSGHAVSL